MKTRLYGLQIEGEEILYDISNAQKSEMINVSNCHKQVKQKSNIILD